jgi:predicted  nucleic acid-binding Zn-ribbon protein
MQVNFITILLLILLLIIIYNFFISNNTENFTKSEELILNKNLINQKKLTLYIFLSRTCPYSLEYENVHHKKLIDDLGSEYIIKKIYSDNDDAELFNKFNIKYVPKGVLKQDENVVEVKGQLRSEVVKNAKKILDNMITNEECTKSIDKKKLLIFLSKTCPHCVNYIEKTHNELYNQLQNDFTFQLIFSDEDNDGLFNKYNVNYVPKGVVISNEKEYEIKGNLNSDNIKNADKIKNIEHMSFETDDEINNKINYTVNNEMNNVNNEMNNVKNEMNNVKNEMNNTINNVNNVKNEMNNVKNEMNNVKNEMNNTINNVNVNNVNNEMNNVKNEMNNTINNVNVNNVNNEMNNVNNVNNEMNNEINNANNEMNNVNDEINNVNDEMNNVNDEMNNVNDEMNNVNDEKKLLVFLSKTCPHCKTYDNVTHNQLLKDLDNKIKIEKVYSDNDTKGLFAKYNIKYVPKGVVISNRKSCEVNGPLKYDNIMNADKINNNNSNEKKLLVFLSKTCHHCKTYDNVIHNQLLKDLDNKIKIEKVYSDNDTQGLFNKYNIKYVPKGVVVSNRKSCEVNGPLKYDNIMNADKINNNDSNEKKLLVFLSKTCPHCKTYDNVTHNQLLKDLDNKIKIEKVYSDNDTQGLFDKYNIKYVPKGVVVSNGKSSEVNGPLKYDNIMNAEKINNIINADKINNNESNENKLLVFLSKTCPHCVTYDNVTHNKLLKDLDNKIKIEKVYSDKDTQGLFNKYNINFVPAGILLSRERHIPIEGIINTENIKEQIKKLKN